MSNDYWSGDRGRKGGEGAGGTVQRSVGPGKQTLTSQLPVQHKPAEGSSHAPGVAAASEEGAELPPRVESLPGMAELLASGDAALATTARPAAPEQAAPRQAPAAPQQVPPGAPAAAAAAPAVTGIESQVAIDRFVAAGHAVQTDWATLTPQQRADHFGAAANAELTQVRVPTAAVALSASLGAAAGELDFPTWTLNLGTTAFSAASVTDATAGAMANTVYHETRHAEQWHRMARVRAGAGVTAADVATQMGIPARVATSAFGQPLSGGGQDATEGNAWYQSVYGTGAAARGTVLQNVLRLAAASQQAQAAYDRVNADPAATPAAKQAAQTAWVAAYNALQPAYAAYRALPEEADAFRAGDAAGAAYARPRLPAPGH
ncbi:MAG: hypothetical protein ABIY55_15260 [Kofleriaceae bacterium]